MWLEISFDRNPTSYQLAFSTFTTDQISVVTEITYSIYLVYSVEVRWVVIAGKKVS